MNIAEYTQSYLLLPTAVFTLLFFLQNRIATSRFQSAASWLNNRRLFINSGEASDQIVLNGARILLGILLIYRLYYIHNFIAPLGISDIQTFALLAYLAVCILLTIGLLAPVAAVILLLFQLHFNFSLNTYTLGIDIAAMILLCFVLYPIGQVMSVDSLLSKKFAWPKKLYNYFIISDRNTQASLAKAISLYSYCLLCLYSVLLHLNEPMWMNGEAAVHLLSSSYLSEYATFFQSLFTNSSLAVILAKASMVGMVIWYLLLGPAILIGGILRKLAIFWALAFFLVSTFILQLSVLPYFEFMILFIWFWDQFQTKPSHSLNMLYDDRCNLCDRTVRSLRILDLHKVLNYRPVSKNLDKAEKLNLPQDELTKNLYSWEQGSNTVYAGYDFYLHVCRHLLLLMPLYPVLLLFKYLKLGPAVYALVAKYRIQWFGVCQLPTDVTKQVSSPITDLIKADNSNTVFKPFFLTAFFLSFLFLAIMPISPALASINKNWPDIIRTVHIFSWTRINVFNREDLGMTQHYYTASAVGDGKEILLPLTSKLGEKLEWHKSDRVYYGNTLQWRRWKNKRDILPPNRRDKTKFCEVIQWAMANGTSAKQEYRFDFYQAEWPYQKNGLFVFPEAKLIGSETYSAMECES